MNIFNWIETERLVTLDWHNWEVLTVLGYSFFIEGSADTNYPVIWKSFWSNKAREIAIINVCYRNPHTSGGQRIERVRHLVLQSLLHTNSQEYALVFKSGTARLVLQSLLPTGMGKYRNRATIFLLSSYLGASFLLSCFRQLRQRQWLPLPLSLFFYSLNCWYMVGGGRGGIGGPFRNTFKRQATLHDYLPSLLGDKDKWSEKVYGTARK